MASLDRITVTRNGRPAAVLMSADDLAALEDTLELLSDPTAMADIEHARREVEAGPCSESSPGCGLPDEAPIE